MPGEPYHLGTSVFLWVVVGAMTGYFVGFLGKRLNQGPNVVGDIIAGLIGAVAGGFPTRFLMPGRPGLYISVVAAVVGAWVLTLAWRAFSGAGRRAT